MRFIHASLFGLALVVFGDTPAPEAVVDWLADAKKHAISPREIVASKFGEANARVVMVGRAFSGTAEFTRFEELFAACATAGDVIALDVGVIEGEALDRWVRTGTGEDPKSIVDSGAFGWSVAEARIWLSDLGKREAKPKIVGIATGDPVPACTAVLAYLGKMNPDALVRAEQALRALTLPGRNGAPRYAQLDDNARVVLRLGLEETLGLIRDSEEAFIAKSSVAEFARHVQLLVGLQQYEEKMRFERDGGEHDPRGKSLAANALAALRNAPETGRLFAFVGLRDLARASDADSFAAQVERVGGVRTVAVATACGSAEFSAIDPNDSKSQAPRSLKTSLADAGPLERALADASNDAMWILDLRKKPTDASVVAWLSLHRSLRSAREVCGAVSETAWDHDLLGDFDAIAWFPTVSRSR